MIQLHSLRLQRELQAHRHVNCPNLNSIQLRKCSSRFNEIRARKISSETKQFCANVSTSFKFPPSHICESRRRGQRALEIVDLKSFRFVAVNRRLITLADISVKRVGEEWMNCKSAGLRLARKELLALKRAACIVNPERRLSKNISCSAWCGAKYWSNYLGQ